MLNEDNLQLFWYWIREREAIRTRRMALEPRPWSRDPILNNNHFCNVHREDDRGTQEIRQVVLNYTWLEMGDLPWVYTAARMFNKASTLDVLLGNWYSTYDHAWDIVKARRDAGNTIFHAAYVVSTCGRRMDKVDYVEEVVGLVSLIDFRHQRLTCDSVFNKLLTINGLGTFLAGQIVADLKNDRFLCYAEDRDTFSCIGPGSRKGLTFIFGKFRDSWYQELMEELYQYMPEDIMGMKIHAQDLQNCLCEFSKYMAIKEGTRGRSRPY